jgi:dolichol kinase
VLLFNGWGYFQPPLDPTRTLAGTALIALAATAVEALPLADIDNITITLTAIALAILWF